MSFDVLRALDDSAEQVTDAEVSDESLLDPNEFIDDPIMKDIVENHNAEAKAKKQRKNKLMNIIKKVSSKLNKK